MLSGVWWRMQGRYFTSFKVPDMYGVYKFMVTYHRTGYTALDLSQTVRCPQFSVSARSHGLAWHDQNLRGLCGNCTSTLCQTLVSGTSLPLFPILLLQAQPGVLVGVQVKVRLEAVMTAHRCLCGPSGTTSLSASWWRPIRTTPACSPP